MYLPLSPYKSAECVFDADIGKTFHNSNLFIESHTIFKLSIQWSHINNSVKKHKNYISVAVRLKFAPL